MLRRFIIIVVMASLSGLAAAQGTTETILFNGFGEGDQVRDQYMFRGVRFPADPVAGPWIDDGGGLGFLLDSPPGLLSLSPYAYIGGANQVHASVGTYVFNFVDPSNPFIPSFTDYVEVVVAFPDHGDTVLTAYDAAGNVIGTTTLTLGAFVFGTERIGVYASGIQKATLTTPQIPPTLGCLVDTLIYNRPAMLPAEPIEIDVKPGSTRNLIRLGDRSTVTVAILSSATLTPDALDPAKVLFQKASPVSYQLVDRNHDRVRDLVLSFRVADLVDLTTATTQAVLTAVDTDGTSLSGVDDVIVQGSQGSGPPVL